ncbi:MAG: hypothetical protein WBR18_03955 [Anaerolineales bacterium]
MPFQHVSIPLTDMGSQSYTRMDGMTTGFVGGLYPDGSNMRPPAHDLVGQQLAATIQPLNEAGEPDPNGRIVLTSIGMSNTGQEFGQFQRLARDTPGINPHLFFINGGVGGRTAENWVDPESDAWEELQRRLDHYSVSDEQVQVAWIKLTLVKGGDFPEKAFSLRDHLEIIVGLLKDRFPNLKIAYLSSRTRSYTYWRGLSPEPVAFETGFAVRWLIQEQLEGLPSLNYDPNKGRVEAPYLAWGPYLWADGENPRQDGFVWLQEDLAGDCTHPSSSGTQKIASLLMDFLMNDSTAFPWFRESSVPDRAIEPTAPSELASAASPTPSPYPPESSSSSSTPSAVPSSLTSIDRGPASSPPYLWLVLAFVAGGGAGYLVFRWTDRRK